MLQELTIRQVEIEDTHNLAELFDLYRQFYKKPSDLDGATRFLHARIDKNESVIFVAQAATGKLYGFTQLYPSFTSLGMERSWILNDLYVVENARRLGIGRLLMNAAHDFAYSSGARSISLETQVENTGAQALYESLGYEAETGFRFYSKSLL